VGRLTELLEGEEEEDSKTFGGDCWGDDADDSDSDNDDEADGCDWDISVVCASSIICSSAVFIESL